MSKPILWGMLMSRLSRFLVSRREARRFSIADVHRALAARGVELTHSAVSRWFSGHNRPDVGQLRMLAYVLEFSAADLVHALTLAAEDLLVGEVRTSAEPDPSVAPAA